MKRKEGITIVVTGAAGFIGSHLVDALSNRNCKIIAIDNLSSGKIDHVEHHLNANYFEFHKKDLASDDLTPLMKDVDIVFHLAANPDVRSSAINPKEHIDQNFIATYNLLEAMRKNDVEKIVFTSTSTVYGTAKQIPTPEDYGPLLPESVYGATKLACEALISSYCYTYGMKAWIFRLANVIGPRLTHGVIYDFVQKLRKNPNELEILGDGNQTKSYIYVKDCIDGMLFALEKAKETVNVFNLGSEDRIRVVEIAEIVCRKMGLNPEFKFTGGKRGWKGDIPIMQLDITKIKALGWRPEYSSKEAVELTVDWMIKHK